MKNLSLKDLINKGNKKKIFTPSPSFPMENILGLSSNFTRNDLEYKKQEKRVLNKLKKISEQKKIVCMQGSGSFALEVGCLNFLRGKILVISTGYYSDRIFELCKFAKQKFGYIKEIKKIKFSKIHEISRKYDWICACYTETSKGFKIPLDELKLLSKKTKSKIFLDSTASIGIEKNHKLADVVTFSSCKSLFGLTGACFISYSTEPKNKISSFMLNINSHINKKMTGPNSTIQSLDFVLKKYSKFKKSVLINKELFQKQFKKYIVYPKKYQPMICTLINKKIKQSKNLIIYKPRISNKGTLVFHLGEGHLEKNFGNIIKYIKIK